MASPTPPSGLVWKGLLVATLAVAGAVDGAILPGTVLVTWLAPGDQLDSTLGIGLLLAGAAIGAAALAKIDGDLFLPASHGRFLVTAGGALIAALLLAAGQVWLLRHVVDHGFRGPLLLASLVLVAAVASIFSTNIRRPRTHPMSWPMTAGGVIVTVLLVLLAAALVWLVFVLGSAFSSFS